VRTARRAVGAEFLIPDSAAAQGTTKWRKCAAEYTVALSRGATGSCRATVPAPIVKELGQPDLVTFRRSGNRFTVAPGGAKAAAAQAAGSVAGGTATRPAGSRGNGRGAGAQRLGDKPPSEMSLETNILRYLANCLERRHDLAEGAVVPVSPTPHEEHMLGFDAMVGLPQGRYAVLQFKRPAGWPIGRARFEIVDRQALTLLRYPRGSAFYVLPPVRTNGEMAGFGRCLLHRARMVDAWDVLGAILQPWRAAGAGATRSGRGGRIPGPREGRDAYVSDRDHGAVHIQAGDGCPPPCLQVLSKPVSALCHDTGGVGFDVKGDRIMTRHGVEWGRGGWTAEAGRVLEAPNGRAYRWSRGRWWAGRGDAAADDDDDSSQRLNVDEVEFRFRQACDHGGGGGGDGEGGGGSYWLRIAGAP